MMPTPTGNRNYSKEIEVNQTIALAKLEETWTASSTTKVTLQKEITDLIHSVIRGNTLTYRYILITGILAKIINPRVHPRALQKGSKLDGAYDARSLCHSAVVPFEHSKGNLWGLSNEPFVNKPARHPQHDKNNPQLRDKTGAINTHELLEWAHQVSSNDLWQALIFIMQLGREQLTSAPKIEVSVKETLSRKNLDKLQKFITEFLQESDGGARLVAVVATFIQLLNPNGKVRVYSPNAPDMFMKTAGDIELYVNDRLLSVFECKDRFFNDNDITHGLKKAVKHRVREYVFISGFNSQHPPTNPEKLWEKYGVDTCWVPIESIFNSWSLALNPMRRAHFGKFVIQWLEEMRRRESSKAAEKIWNKIMAYG